jgi:hypothetical protein
LPYGTDVRALAPQITVSAKASVSPASGTARDFANPVTYTVTAQDGSAQDYTVTVTVTGAPPVPSDEKAITAFSVDGVDGAIDEAAKTIAVTLPYGSNISSLTPELTHTGVNYSPPGAQNFTRPVTYYIMAEDGAMQNYTVTITVLKNPAKAITWFYFSVSAGYIYAVIDEEAHTITAILPFETNLSSLEPGVSHTGANYSPAGYQDFSNPVTYTVTA